MKLSPTSPNSPNRKPVLWLSSHPKAAQCPRHGWSGLVRSAFPSYPSPNLFRTLGFLSPFCSLCSSHAGLPLCSASGPLHLLSLLLGILFLTFSTAHSLTSSRLGCNVTSSSEVFPTPIESSGAFARLCAPSLRFASLLADVLDVDLSP